MSSRQSAGQEPQPAKHKHQKEPATQAAPPISPQAVTDDSRTFETSGIKQSDSQGTITSADKQASRRSPAATKSLTQDASGNDGQQAPLIVQGHGGSTPAGNAGNTSVLSQASSSTAQASASANASGGTALSGQALDNVVQQVQGLHSAGGGGTATLQLTPQSMGQLHIQVHVSSNGQAQVHFTTEHSHAAQALNQSVDQLSSALAQSGLTLTHAQAVAGNAGSTPTTTPNQSGMNGQHSPHDGSGQNGANLANQNGQGRQQGRQQPQEQAAHLARLASNAPGNTSASIHDSSSARAYA